MIFYACSSIVLRLLSLILNFLNEFTIDVLHYILGWCYCAPISLILCDFGVIFLYWTVCFQWLNKAEVVGVAVVGLEICIWVMMLRSILRLEGIMGLHIKEMKLPR